MSDSAYKWGGHALLGRIAFSTLPQWQQELVEPDMSPEGLDRPYLPKGAIETAGDKMGFLCSIMDLVYYDECRPYATLPDGRWIPHAPPDENWQACAGTGQAPSPAASMAITELLMNRTIDAMRTKDWEEAIRHAGALGHYLEEPFTPGHAMDNRIFHEVFPDPDPTRHMRLHHAFDCASDLFDPRPPKLMGTSVPEAAFHLQMELDNGVVEAKKLVALIIRSVYDGQPAKVRAAMLGEQAGWASYVTACAWHTAFCIAFDRFEPQEVEALKEVSLIDSVPYFWHACQYVHVVPGKLVKKSRTIPIHVWTTNGDGRREQQIENGFGMGGHMGAKFAVNGEVHSRFRCRAGLPSQHTEGQCKHTDTRFFVELDEQENTVYSEDIEYRTTPVFERQLVPGEPVFEVDVDISGAKTLILKTQCQPYKNPETGQQQWFVPHVAICEPTLIKRPL